VLLRQAQHRRLASADFCLAVAKSCIAGKLKNCRQVLLRGARENGREDDNAVLTASADELGRALPDSNTPPISTPCAASKATQAKRYFAALTLLVRPEARDRFSP
jgi:CRISPR-associated protein Cas1